MFPQSFKIASKIDNYQTGQPFADYFEGVLKWNILIHPHMP